MTCALYPAASLARRGSLADLQEDLTPSRPPSSPRAARSGSWTCARRCEWDEGRHRRRACTWRWTSSPPRPARSTGDPPVVFYCRTGARSARGGPGVPRVGLHARTTWPAACVAWVERGLPLEPDDGQRGDPLGRLVSCARVGPATGEAGGAAAGAELERLAAIAMPAPSP